MNAAIIGAGGFIGRRLATHLAEHDWHVHGLDVTPSDSTDGLTIHRCDVTAGPIQLPREVQVVFYLAQSPHYRRGQERLADLYAVNVLGALRSAAAARTAGATLFVYASTGNVYAPSFSPLRESDPVRRDDAYALSKITAEEALALAADSMHVLRVRLFGVFGPGQGRMLVPNLLQRLRDGSPIDIERRADDAADVDGLRLSLCFVDDAVEMLRRLAEFSAGSPGHEAAPLPDILNVAGPRAVSIRELAIGLAESIGAKARFEVHPRHRAGDYVADIGRLRSLVDTRFTSLEEAIARITADLTGVSHVS